MGCDIGDVLRVVQYNYPQEPSQLVQRLGRAARHPELKGLGLLLILPSTQGFKNIKVKNLLRYLTRTERRRELLNEQKTELKAVIKKWRTETFQVRLGWSPIYDEEWIMTDDLVEALANKADQLILLNRYHLPTNGPYDHKSLEDLANEIINFNNRLDTIQKSKKRKRVQVSETHGESSLAQAEGSQAQAEGSQVVF
ncbi:hypothetical protein BGZ65_009805 [Modicella reniformis]|uniref:Helicase C-terminal domain-containing protein n=1 Tax=Modicella reniformis TaxID=1440133 RepID=A0A9P6JJ30_9FUNG|nr:hypothetical protein BGZ65_009805 [Modicella reniformis]